MIEQNKKIIIEASVEGIIKFALKIMLIVLILSGFLWLVGAHIANSLPLLIRNISKYTFIISTSLYVFLKTFRTREQENGYQKSLEKRDEKIDKVIASGFKMDVKLYGYFGLFAVDKSNRDWFYLDYYNQPSNIKVYSISEIRKIEKRICRECITLDHKLRMFNGIKLSRKDAYKYLESTGVAIEVEGEQVPFFINCYKTENDAELIIHVMNDLINKEVQAERKGT